MESPRPSFAAIATTLAGLALLALMVLAIPELRDAFAAAVRGDSDEVERQIDQLGLAGPLLILALALIHTVVFYPAEILDAAAGFAYGFFPALALMMFGWLLSGLVCFAVGRSVARPLLDRFFGTERFERIEGAIERGGVTLLLAVRLIPIVPAAAARPPPEHRKVDISAGLVRLTLQKISFLRTIGMLGSLTLTEQMTKTMARKPDTARLTWDELLDKHSRESDSLSDTISRMLESGDLEADKENWPSWIGAGSSGLGDLGLNAEKYLGIKPWGPGEKPGEWRSDKDAD